MKICPIEYKIFSQITSKFCQIINEPFQYGQSFLTVCQSGEISPNLVTLFYLTRRRQTEDEDATTTTTVNLEVELSGIYKFRNTFSYEIKIHLWEWGIFAIVVISASVIYNYWMRWSITYRKSKDKKRLELFTSLINWANETGYAIGNFVWCSLLPRYLGICWCRVLGTSHRYYQATFVGGKL